MYTKMDAYNKRFKVLHREVVEVKTKKSLDEYFSRAA